MPPFYETDRAAAEYPLFHYGSDDLRMPWPGGPAPGLPLPARCVGEALAGHRVEEQRCGRIAFCMDGHCVGCEVTTGTVAGNGQAGATEVLPLCRSPGIRVGGGGARRQGGVFRRRAVRDIQHRAAQFPSQMGAGVVVGFQAADDPAAAMEKH